MGSLKRKCYFDEICLPGSETFQLWCRQWRTLWRIWRHFSLSVLDRETSLRPGQNCRHFADDIFKCILLNENVSISHKISLKFVPRIPIDNIQVLVRIMAWRRSIDKPLSEPMLIILLNISASLGLSELKTQSCCRVLFKRDVLPTKYSNFFQEKNINDYLEINLNQFGREKFGHKGLLYFSVHDIENSRCNHNIISCYISYQGYRNPNALSISFMKCRNAVCDHEFILAMIAIYFRSHKYPSCKSTTSQDIQRYDSALRVWVIKIKKIRFMQMLEIEW